VKELMMGENKLDILFVIVLYKIGLEQSQSYRSMLSSLQNAGAAMDLLVYDNSPVCKALPTGIPAGINIIYVNDNKNSGVSKAYNYGAGVAKELGKKWVLLLDQDTDFPAHSVETYISAIAKYPQEKLFAPIMCVSETRIISPCRFKLMRGFTVSYVDVGINSLVDYSVINSGMLINVEAFFKNNGYNELIKLDFSDHDFVKRFKKTVTDRFVIINLKVYHQLSSETKNSLTTDQIRFDYYLSGAKNISATIPEVACLKVNALLRSFKLSVVHKNVSFLAVFLGLKRSAGALK
jgi:rhamnosyltransferase